MSFSRSGRLRSKNSQNLSISPSYSFNEYSKTSNYSQSGLSSSILSRLRSSRRFIKSKSRSKSKTRQTYTTHWIFVFIIMFAFTLISGLTSYFYWKLKKEQMNFKNIELSTKKRLEYVREALSKKIYSFNYTAAFNTLMNNKAMKKNWNQLKYQFMKLSDFTDLFEKKKRELEKNFQNLERVYVKPYLDEAETLNKVLLRFNEYIKNDSLDPIFKRNMKIVEQDLRVNHEKKYQSDCLKLDKLQLFDEATYRHQSVVSHNYLLSHAVSIFADTCVTPYLKCNTFYNLNFTWSMRHIIELSIEDIKQNLFPHNIIYIQYDRLSGPNRLWPSTSWKDITRQILLLNGYDSIYYTKPVNLSFLIFWMRVD